MTGSNGSACHGSCYSDSCPPRPSGASPYARSLLLRSTFAATAPRSAVAELGVVGRCSRLVKTTFLATLLLIGLGFSGIAAISDSCSSTIRFLDSSPASDGQRDYRFTFTNRFSHSVYYLAYRHDVADFAGQPFHYERFRRWGCWSDSEYQLRDVRMVFRRVRSGETLSFRITRPRSFCPWSVSIFFYPKPDYAALRGEVSSDPIPK